MLPLVLATALIGCRDEDLFDRNEMPGGEMTLNISVAFKPLATQEVSTSSRAGGTEAPSGTSYSGINSLYILFFDADKNIVREYSGPVTNYTGGTGMRPDGTNIGEETAEDRTNTATFSKRINAGQYYVFTVANVSRTLLDAVTTIDELRSIQLDWNSELKDNLGMLGVCAPGDPSDAENRDIEADQLLLLTPKTSQIHSWMRRAVAKVTVAFDGSKLRNNVRIYIRSARLYDVSSGCYLGKASKVEEGGFTTKQSDYEITYGSGADYTAWPFVSRGAPYLTSYKEGNNEIEFHSQSAKALPCFENLQGPGPSKLADSDGDGKIDDPNEKKDSMPKGTYLEVEGYYVNNNNGVLSDGKIIYRFMLGADEKNNYDVVRNHHYKVTLCISGQGNDYDWHIEYVEKTPDLFVHDVMASYAYNQPVPINIRVVGGKVESLTAKIIRNDWHPEQNINNNTYFENKASKGWSTITKNDTYFGYVQDGVKHPEFGFLTLYKPTKNRIEPPASATNNDIFQYPRKYWNGTTAETNETGKTNGKLGTRSDYIASGLITNYDEKTKESVFRIEAYTREKNIVTTTGYTGQNFYESGGRVARVEITAKVKVDGETTPRTCKDTITVRQAQRVVNPTAIYRSATNNKSFHVNLKVADVEPNSPENIAKGNYIPLKSIGPWRAEIENIGNPGMISLSKQWGDDGEEIDFNVNFSGAGGDPSFAIIDVWYHNYSCLHRIFVRKGYNPAAVAGSTPKWHAFNVDYKKDNVVHETADPLDEGSLFRYANMTYAISPKTNDTYGYNKSVGSNNLTIKQNTNVDWGSITSPSILANVTNNGVITTCNYKSPNRSLIQEYYGDNTIYTTFAKVRSAANTLISNNNVRPARFSDFNNLRTNANVDFAFGIVYGDDATETATTMAEAYGYCPASGRKAGYGMRCVIAYNKTTAAHVMFPIGSAGFGQRIHNTAKGDGNIGNEFYAPKDNIASALTGALRYAGRALLMNADLAESRPIFWNIKYSKGAIYWLAVADTTDKSASLSSQTSWDMNYTTFDFNTYNNDAFPSTGSSNACYIRCVTK